MSATDAMTPHASGDTVSNLHLNLRDHDSRIGNRSGVRNDGYFAGGAQAKLQQRKGKGE